MYIYILNVYLGVIVSSKSSYINYNTKKMQSEASIRSTTKWIIPYKYRNIKRNNHSNIFIVLGTLKSLLCFPLNIDLMTF